MSEVVAAILLGVLTLYAVLGGADFGGGLWDLLAGGERAGRAPRQLIDETITPVWEANHVWLVFALVVFWTAFPTPFAAVMTALAVPLWLAALGIVLRGAGFAFRKEVEGLGAERALGAVFAVSSMVTPFFMGTVVGAVAAGRVPARPAQASLAAWTCPTALLIGALFVAVCGYQAAVFLIGEACRRGEAELERYFRVRAAIAAAVAGALSLAALAVIHGSNHALYRGLTGRALPLVILAGGCGIAALLALAAGRTRGLRVLAVAGVTATVWGWGVGQYPALLPGTGVTLSNGSAPHGTLVATLAVAIAAVVLVAPSALLLFRLHGSQMLDTRD